MYIDYAEKSKLTDHDDEVDMGFVTIQTGGGGSRLSTSLDPHKL